MKPDRSYKLQPPIDLDIVVKRRTADPARRARLVHLLAVLLDKPNTPEEGQQPCRRRK